MRFVSSRGQRTNKRRKKLGSGSEFGVKGEKQMYTQVVKDRLLLDEKEIATGHCYHLGRQEAGEIVFTSLVVLSMVPIVQCGLPHFVSSSGL